MKMTKTIICCFLGFGLITFGTLGKKAVAADFLQTTTTNNDSENVAILQKRLQAKVKELTNKTEALKAMTAKATNEVDAKSKADAKSKLAELQAEVTDLNQEVTSYQDQISQLNKKEQLSLKATSEQLGLVSQKAAVALDQSKVAVN